MTSVHSRSRKVGDSNSAFRWKKDGGVPRTNSLLAERRKLKVEPDSVTPKKTFASKTKRHRMSDRLNELAQPRIRMILDDISKKELLSLKSLIIYKTRPRLLELAKPRKVEKLVPREIGRIPSRVLRAQPTPRVIELSQPRRIYTIEKPPKIKSVSQRSNRNLISRLTTPSPQFSAEYFKIPEVLRKKFEQQLQRNRDKGKKSLRTSASVKNVIDVKLKNKQSASNSKILQRKELNQRYAKARL